MFRHRRFSGLFAFLILVACLAAAPGALADQSTVQSPTASPAKSVTPSGPASRIFHPTHAGKKAAPTWSCYEGTNAGAATQGGLNVMWGQGFTSCDTGMEAIDMTVTAWYCSPLAWGCVWIQQGQMGPGCTYNSTAPSSYQWCPASGSYTWNNNGAGMQPGQLWAVQTQYDYYAWDGTSGHDTTSMSVQF